VEKLGSLLSERSIRWEACGDSRAGVVEVEMDEEVSVQVEGKQLQSFVV
jgi:hypothetical protein